MRLFSLAAELGNVREACRIFGIHPSTYYRWRGPVLRSGLEMLRHRQFALARRLAADLRAHGWRLEGVLTNGSERRRRPDS